MLMSAPARKPAIQLQGPSAMQPRVCAGIFLFIMSVLLLLPGSSLAQLTLLANDPYAKLIFDPVPLPEAATAGNADTGLADNEAPANAAALRNIREYEAAIDRVLEEDGLYSPQLREQYQALAAHQQSIGRHEDAVATLERAMHIARVNEGLVTTTQLEDLERIIANLQASRNVEREAEFRGYLYYVQQQAYPAGDPRLVAATQAWANWNLLNYQQGISANPYYIQMSEGGRIEEFMPLRDDRAADVRFIPRRSMMDERMTGLGGIPDGARFSFTAEMITDYRLRLVRDIYNRLLDDSGDELDVDTEETIRLKLADADYTFKRQIDMLLSQSSISSASVRQVNSRREVAAVGRNYRALTDSLQGIADKRRSSDEADPLALARTLLRLGDVHLVYEQPARAHTSYREAWQVLQSAGFDAHESASILLPQAMIPAPDFATHLYSRALFGIDPEQNLDYLGHIDVRMNISRFGESRRISITQASAGTPQRVRSKLLSYLRTQKFRPLLRDDVFTDQNDIHVRFYYTY
jgi:hypothetical protein